MTVLVTLLAGLVAACGGGGSGGGEAPNYTGDLSLWLETGKMDAGDLCHVRIDIREPNPSGVILKLRFPTSLKYSEGSAVLFAGDDGARWIDPSTSVTIEKNRYVVFFLKPHPSDLGGHLAVELDVKGIKKDLEATIAADLDNNDPNIPDSREFDERRPRFSAMQEHGIRIFDDSETSGDDSSDAPSSDGASTPTATPTAQASATKAQ
jgi:hypothetical protein